MTRRRASTRRARWLLTASAAAGGGMYAWTHVTWLSTGSCIAVWVLYGLARLAPKIARRHGRRQPRPRVTVTNPIANHPTSFDPHGTYHAYNGPRVWYVGENGIRDGERDFITRATEHVASENEWWPREITAVIPTGWYPTKLAAQAAEAYDIHTLDPPRNKTHRNWIHTLDDCPTIARARAAGYTIPPPSTARPMETTA